MHKKIWVIGGDLRQLTAAKLFADDGYEVFLYGFDNERCENDLKRASDADIIVLPMPVSTDDTYLNAPHFTDRIALSELAECINPTAVVFGGQIREGFAQTLEKRGIEYCDYLKREELSIKNAVPTAEGAIELAMSETPFTLHNSRCIVTGYGRIGKILSRMLGAIGARVSVEARKFSDLAMIEASGYEAIPLNSLSERIGDFDIAFNTVPHMIFDREMLGRLKKNALLIDLASRPGGVDFYLDKVGFNAKIPDIRLNIRDSYCICSMQISTKNSLLYVFLILAFIIFVKLITSRTY